jgi:hypothetical protein
MPEYYTQENIGTLDTGAPEMFGIPVLSQDDTVLSRRTRALYLINFIREEIMCHLQDPRGIGLYDYVQECLTMLNATLSRESEEPIPRIINMLEREMDDIYTQIPESDQDNQGTYMDRISQILRFVRIYTD